MNANGVAMLRKVSQRAPPQPSRTRRAAIVSIAFAWVAMLTAVACLNARPRSVPGFSDLDNPFAQPWYAEDRVEYGWPLTARRRFVGSVDEALVAPGRTDWFGAGLDLIVGLGLCAGLASASWLTLRRPT